MTSQFRPILLSGLSAFGLIWSGLAVGVATPANQAVSAEAQDNGPKLDAKAASVAALQKSLDQTTPPAITRLLGTVSLAPDGGGVRYNGFTRRAIAEALEKGSVPGLLTPLPKLSPTNAGTIPNLLTDDHVRKILADKLKSLSHAVAPKDLKTLIKNQNASAARRMRGRQVKASVSASPSTQPSPSQQQLDWRAPGLVVQDSGIVTAVKNQGSCGCCWAFATIAAVEAAYARDNQVLINASEQYVLNNSGFLANSTQPFTCEGGWWAFDLLLSGTSPGGNSPGVPTENAVPYTGSDSGVSPGGLALPYQLQAWGYVETNQPTNIPTDDELKAALCNYGPIAVAVYVPTQDDGSATYAWAMNHGDPLGDFVNDPNRGISHVVLLIGWDDNVVTSADGTQKGAWIFKNSWGEWGIPIKGNSDVGSGFGYVKYGNNNIGLGAAWVTPVASQ